MVAFDDTDTYTFVFLYSREAVLACQEHRSPGEVLTTAGFRTMAGGDVGIDLTAVASGSPIEEPLMLSLDGREAYAECKLPEALGARSVELQLGSTLFFDDSLFSDARYSSELRDALVSCVEQLASLPGFEAGFAMRLGKDQSEEEYRDWFAECVVDGRLSLARLVHHGWISGHALFVGPSYLSQHGRDVFLKCPAWKVSAPRDDVLCVFLDNVFPGIGRVALKQHLSHVREAMPYLRQHLGE